MREIRDHFQKTIDYVNIVHNERKGTWDLTLAKYDGPDLSISNCGIHQMVTLVKAVSGFVPECYTKPEVPVKKRREIFKVIPVWFFRT